MLSVTQILTAVPSVRASPDSISLLPSHRVDLVLGAAGYIQPALALLSMRSFPESRGVQDGSSGQRPGQAEQVSCFRQAAGWEFLMDGR